MIDKCGWLITQPLPRLQQPETKLGVFVADLAARTRTQVGSKTNVSCKNPPLKGHVGAERRFGKWTSFRAQVKHSERGQAVALVDWKPGRRGASPQRKDASACTGPLPPLQTLSQVLQPGRPHSDIVIDEGQDVATSLPDPRIERLRFALLRFEYVTETPWVPPAKILDHCTRLVARIVVYHQNFPLG